MTEFYCSAMLFYKAVLVSRYFGFFAVKGFGIQLLNEWFVLTTTLHLKSYDRLFNEVLAVAMKCDMHGVESLLLHLSDCLPICTESSTQ